MGNGVVRGVGTTGSKVTNMADSSVDPPGSSTGSPVMDRVKKILNSPLTRRKNKAYFGVHLEELAQREKNNVPLLVRRVCAYILIHGIEQEGLFRINGNSKVVEQLRASFNKTGDADLEECRDIMAAASLLKLFLRELPDAVVPESMTKDFVTALHDHTREKEVFVSETKALLSKMPEPNYSLLKYLCRFLVKVTARQETNKMSPVSLGIVFGPNLFSAGLGADRCTAGLAGLKEQGVSNEIVRRFIDDYETFFLKEGEISPRETTLTQTPVKMPPARPPPPKVDSPGMSPLTSPGMSPVPSPRKRVDKVVTLPGETKAGDEDTSHQETPRFSEDELVDAGRPQSPFVLDSDRSEASVAPSPLLPVVTETVEKVIANSVTEHLFGGALEETQPEPVPAPRRRSGVLVEEPQHDPGSPLGGEDIISLSDDDNILDLLGDSSQPKRQKASVLELIESYSSMDMEEREKLVAEKLHADEHIENDGKELIQTATHGVEHVENGSRQPVPKPRGRKDSNRLSNGESSIQPGSKDAQACGGPSSQQTPTRRSLKAALEEQGRPAGSRWTDRHTDGGGDGKQEEVAPLSDDGDEGDENHNEKPSISFLDLHHNGRQGSPERSPVGSRKPYVPPLDLSILHEHGDGSDPILAQHGPSLAFQKGKTLHSQPDDAILSPRTLKLKKKSSAWDIPTSPSAFRVIGEWESANCDTDVPPSPPTDLPVSLSGHRMAGDDTTGLVKQLNKKAQGLKKKIRQFEEEFEDQHGYKPSHANKAANPDIKKAMLELTKTRKDLKQIKERVENERFSSVTVTPSPSLEEEDLRSDGEPTMSETLQSLLHRLEEKRATADRCEDINAMSTEEVKDEKLAVQKALLHFESLHGRPSTKAEKELMKPLYDRYRAVKRLLSRPLSPRDRMKELQTVPEGHTMDFSPSTASSDQSTNREPIKIPTCVPRDTDPEDFMVTQDVGLLRDAVHSFSREAPPSPAERKLNQENTKLVATKTAEGNLHEMSMKQLYDEQYKAKSEKKRLRKILRDYEDDFFRQTGRKVLKEDRVPMEMEYQDYKRVKARLKLLDALIHKQDSPSVM